MYQSTTTHTRVLGHNSHKTSPFPSKIKAGFTENVEVALENYPTLSSQAPWTFLIKQC